MSGRELDPDGTDSYHPEHPWEQTAHLLYLPPARRTRDNWPPVAARPVGPYERDQWKSLPERPAPGVEFGWFGPGHSYPAPPDHLVGGCQEAPDSEIAIAGGSV
jgi:hypothetical protein